MFTTSPAVRLKGVCAQCRRFRFIRNDLCHACRKKVPVGSCRNCRREMAVPKRGLCVTCYKNKKIRKQFPRVGFIVTNLKWHSKKKILATIASSG